MSGVAFQSDRRFRSWTYRVGHAQLLLRSTKDEAHSTRLDVLFVGVEHVNIPTTLDGLTVTRAGDVYQLHGEEWNGTIQALVFRHAEDEGEYFDPSTFADGSGI